MFRGKKVDNCRRGGTATRQDERVSLERRADTKLLSIDQLQLSTHREREETLLCGS
jgi:hypothetical protein